MRPIHHLRVLHLRTAGAVAAGALASFLASVAWAAVPAAEAAATPPVEMSVRAGEVQTVEIGLGRSVGDPKPWEVRIEPASDDGEAGEQPEVLLGLVEEGEPVPRRWPADGPPDRTRLPAVAGSRSVHLRVLAHPCSEGGALLARLVVGSAAGAAAVRVPVRIRVEATRTCLWRSAGIWGSAGGFFLLVLGGFLIWDRSSFLPLRRVGESLRPLGSSGPADPVAWRRADQPQVQRRIERSLPWWRRLETWLRANPFALLKRGESYREAVELFPARHADRISATAVAGRDVLGRLRSGADGTRRGLLVVAGDGAGFRVYAVPDLQGRVAGLQPDRPIGTPAVPAPIPPGTALFYESDGSDEPVVGWRISGPGSGGGE